jgi:tetratricopeptide (TPR) repeat protein
MPKQGSEVPHSAFHHHRIGIHRDSQSASEVIAGLTPVLGAADLTSAELARGEALAKFQVSQEEPDNPSFRDYGIDAAKTLIQIKNAGNADPDVNTILALLARSQGQSGIAQDLATEVVETEKIPSRARIEAVRLLAQLAYQRRDFTTAVKHFRQLTTYVEEPFDFFNLGISEQNAGDSEKAIAALKKCVELEPTYLDAHRALTAILQSKGRWDEATRQADLAKQHEQRLQSIWQASQPK